MSQRVYTQLLFVALILALCSLQHARPFMYPSIQEPDFRLTATINTGVKGRLSIGAVNDPENGFIYYSFGYSPAFIVKYNIYTQQVQEWVSMSSNLRGCVLRIWRGHLIAMKLQKDYVTVIKYSNSSLLLPPIEQGPFNIDTEVYGKLDTEETDTKLIVTLTPVNTKDKEHTMKIALLDLNTFSIIFDFISIGSHDCIYSFYGRNASYVMVGGPSRDDPSIGKIAFLSLEDWTVKDTRVFSRCTQIFIFVTQFSLFFIR
jgi:hypothetical protein